MPPFPAYPRLTNSQDDRELVRWWLSFKAPNTQKTYAARAREFLEFTGKPLRETLIDDILLWLESLQLRQASRNTIYNKLAALKSLFGFGLKTGYLTIDPTASIKAIKPGDAIHERLMEVEEVHKLLASATPGRDRCIIKLLYLLGLRVSELVGLDWNDFRKNDRCVTVAVLGKGNKTRVLAIDFATWNELLTLPRSEKTDAVFLSLFGNRLDRQGVHRMIKATVERAGLNPHISAHWLRHAHACHCLKNGAGIELLMKSMGHSSLAITARYLHINDTECSSNFINI